MLGRDRVSASFEMKALAAIPGHAVVTMTIRDDMLNGFDVAHGGVIFMLADTAFALACNESDAVTLAVGADIAFLRSAHPAQTLTATASRRSLVGRSGVYDVRVENELAEVVAEFRGKSLTTSRPDPSA